MRLRTRLILALCFLALLLANSFGWGRPWARVLADGLFVGVVLIHLGERRLRGAGERTILGLNR